MKDALTHLPAWKKIKTKIHYQTTKQNKTKHRLNKKQLGLERLIIEMGKAFKKNRRKKILKNKINVKTPHVKKKPPARNKTLLQTKKNELWMDS